MNILALYINQWFHERHVRAIHRYVLRHDFAEQYVWERSAIYRVPLPDAIAIDVMPSGAGEGIHFERTLLELIGLGRRCYILDSEALAMFGKPVAFFVFNRLKSDPVQAFRSTGHILINGAPFPFFDTRVLRQQVVHGETAIPQAQTAGPNIQAMTITGPFPGGDLPTPTAPPLNGPNATPPANATLLFYGLCFQNPIADPAPGTTGDPLWIQTNNIAVDFRARGFRTWTGLAGDNVQYEPNATANAHTFSALMDAFSVDFAAQTAFCNNAADQLVILIAAHGYGQNPTGKIAFHCNPSAGVEEWITHVELCDQIAAVGAALGTWAANKTYLIVYSCRSGPLIDDELPGTLQGMHVITSTTASELSNTNYGPTIQESLGRCDGSWTSFIEWLKYLGSGNGLPAPRNGDVKGCRWQITLQTVTHGGGDMGNDWLYEIVVNNDRTDIPEHSVGIAVTDTLNRGVYDRFRGPCTPAPAPPGGTARAGERDLGTDWGSAPLAFPATPCDGIARSHQVVVNVSEGSVTATMTFSFNITANCVP